MARLSDMDVFSTFEGHSTVRLLVAMGCRRSTRMRSAI
jgi:hypothetical protein